MNPVVVAPPGTYNRNMHVFDLKTTNYIRELKGHLGTYVAEGS